MLIELAIGDAYGAGFEYVSTKIVREKNDLSGYKQHPRHLIVPGAYTDDTQMTISIAEKIISGDAWTKLNLANSFVRSFKRDPREGYARGFYAFLEEVKDGGEFLNKIKSDSEKSGAAMRASPVGLFPDMQEVIERTELQASITHGTSSGINSALAASLTVHYFAYDLGDKKELGLFLEDNVAGEWSRVWKGKVGAKGVVSVHAAVSAIMESDSMSELLKKCIAYTGDVDTVATIALAAGYFSKEIGNDLPSVLKESLEKGKYGQCFLENLSDQILSYFNLRKRH